MKILLVGSGGREHALAWKLRQSTRVSQLLIAPGNAGTPVLGRNVPIDPIRTDDLLALAVRETVDLVVVGPEGPLVAGIADRLADRGIRCFGPKRAAAAIEGSKVFGKSLMAATGVPTARSHVFHTPDDALAFLETNDWSRWRVAKADGLHAGKGVVVAESLHELEAAIHSLVTTGEPLLLEEPLEGPEISLLAFVDGRTAVVMPAAQDHKRLEDGDRGPNTGGMGAYAPVPGLDHAAVEALGQQVIAPIITALAARGAAFTGVLFAGLILTPDGPRVLEYNCRWGDPEAQVLLPLLAVDLLDIIEACVEGRLDPAMVRWRSGATLGVVLAAANYPASPRRGDPITFPVGCDGAHTFHAGTGRQDDTVVTAGGRVVTVVGEGASLAEARSRAYACAEQIQFAGRQMRSDIGWRALEHANAGG